MKCVRNFAQLVSVSLEMIIATTLNDFLRKFSDNINLASTQSHTWIFARSSSSGSTAITSLPSLQTHRAGWDHPQYNFMAKNDQTSSQFIKRRNLQVQAAAPRQQLRAQSICIFNRMRQLALSDMSYVSGKFLNKRCVQRWKSALERAVGGTMIKYSNIRPPLRRQPSRARVTKDATRALLRLRVSFRDGILRRLTIFFLMSDLNNFNISLWMKKTKKIDTHLISSKTV